MRLHGLSLCGVTSCQGITRGGIDPAGRFGVALALPATGRARGSVARGGADFRTRWRSDADLVVMKRKHLTLALRILLAAAGIVYIAIAVQWADQIDSDGAVRLGIVTMLRGANVWLLAAGLAMVSLVYPMQTFRWWVLMRCRGMDVPLCRAFRLMMVGSFFNLCMPGMTGGDVVKAYYAAKNSGRGADAVMSVIFDRVAGLLALVLLAGVAGLFMLDHPVARQVVAYIWLGAAGLAAAAAVYYSGPLRRLMRVEKLLAKLPAGAVFTAVDQAAVAYGRHKRHVLAAVLVSVPVHILLAMAVTTAAYAFGVDSAEVTPGFMLTVVPVLSMAGSLPLTYQGLGVMEGLGRVLIEHATFNQIVGMLMMLRLFQIVWSLGGSLFLLRGDIHLHPED